MCGIAGAISTHDDPRTGAAAVRLASNLVHRGPDGEGFWSLTRAGEQARGRNAVADNAASIALGHRRLSIVDIDGGSQPMSNGSGQVWVAFNGEIYNHLELRRELEQLGHRFRSRSDTEVLIHGWQSWGAGVFERLNGIFALAIVDVRERSVILARDPLGVKPLYVGTQRGITWWASELRAATEAELLDKELSADALRLFLTFRFVPSPYAIYQSARKVPPSHYCRLGLADAGSTPTFQHYRTRINSSALPKSESDWAVAMKGTLRAAVRRQLMSDVPVATLLSGGVDSTVISRIMAQESPVAPNAFAIGVRAQNSVDETEAASLAATELRLSLETLHVSEREFSERWPTAVGGLDEPVANPGMMLVGRLCQLVGQTHKVVLTGQGADEPLGGYPRHMAERLWKFGRVAPRLTGLMAQQLVGGEAAERLSRVVRATDHLDRVVEILATVPTRTVDAITSSSGQPARELARTVVGKWFDDRDERDSVNALLYVDARLSLADDLLTVADHFSMQSSVELRVPFLDLEFIELVERMPSRYKISLFGARKWLYRRVAREIIPRESANRLCGIRARFGRKQGFSVPVAALSDPNSLSARVPSLNDSLGAVVNWTAVLQGDAFRSERQRGALLTLAVWAGSTSSAPPSIAA